MNPCLCARKPTYQHLAEVLKKAQSKFERAFGRKFSLRKRFLFGFIFVE